MSEIIQLQIGKTGNLIGNEFWAKIADEHGINELGCYQGYSDYQKDNIGRYFLENKEGKYIPHSLLIDLEPTCLDSIKTSKYGYFYSPLNFFTGKYGTKNVFYFGNVDYEKDELIRQIDERLRQIIEKCDSFGGFQLCFSLCGGTSGLSCELIKSLHSWYCNKGIFSFCQLPSPTLSTAIENMNTIMGFESLHDCNINFMFDNDGLSASKHCSLNNFGEYNRKMGDTMADITVGMRFCGESGVSLNKLATNLVSFPRVNNILISRTETIQNILANENYFCNIDNSSEKHQNLGSAYLIRGMGSLFNEKLELKEMWQQKSMNYRNFPFDNGWLFDEMLLGKVDTSFLKNKANLINSRTFLLNSPVFRSVLSNWEKNFPKKKSFLSQYSALSSFEDIDIEMMFCEALSHVNDMMCEYQGGITPWGADLDSYIDDDYSDDDWVE
eukprot:TRINITY_DN2275_c0_g1_i1.p1 TRINITY_DN2275_c0_g1~~TRINITY_DN2275_c0_g1_i1.p1  ORF type:complete len:441 (+),score=120.17 TRINITY_DN2275_c0_g1_i1:1351-2673(+)